MIKRVMYFYDKKQADLIKKVNDKLHKQRGVRVSDADDASKIKKDIKEIKNAKDTKSLNSILQPIKGFI